jgi:pentatricopeptide repeat protein
MAALISHAWPALLRTRLPAELLALSITTWRQSHRYISSAVDLSADTPGMAAFRKLPYPNVPVDGSVFEDVSEDYGISPTQPTAVATDAALADIPAQRQPGMLARLVEEQRWEDAERIRKEMVESGFSIDPDAAYQQAALHVLRSSGLAKQGLADAFVAWYSLIPLAKYSTHRASTNIQRTLFTELLRSQLDLDTIIRFSLISASKGYAGTVAADVIPFVFRAAHPSISAEFLSTFVREARNYIATHVESETKPGNWARRRYSGRLAYWYSMAIRTHYTAGRFPDGRALVAQAEAAGIRLTKFTTTLVAGNVQHRDFSTKIDDVSSLSTPTTPYASMHAMGSRLLQMRTAIASSPPPLPSAIAAFLADYRAANGRPRALRKLRSLAHNTSFSAFSNWVLGEMIYYKRRGEHHLALLTFKDCCHPPTAVPPGYETQLQEVIGDICERRGVNKSVIINEALSSWERQPMSVWPTSYHTALLWQSCVALTPRRNLERVQRMYNELLNMVQASRAGPAVTSSQNPHQESAVPLIPPAHRFDAAHFLPFIIRFSLMAPHEAAGIIKDMAELGIQPNLQCWTALAIGYARRGESEQASRILRWMEESVITPPSDAQDGAPAQSMLIDDDRPVPTLVTYTGILHGLLHSRPRASTLPAALDVRDRLFRSTGYVPGSNKKTDEALDTLDAMLRAPPGIMKVCYHLAS